MSNLNFDYFSNMKKIKKIVISSSCDKSNANYVKDVVSALSCQSAFIVHAKRSNSSFKIREGDPINCIVTLRRAMKEAFMLKFCCCYLSQYNAQGRGFLGFSINSFDSNGNFSLGLSDTSCIFDLSAYDKFFSGIGISMLLDSNDNQSSVEILKRVGVPFDDGISNEVFSV